MWKLIGLVMAVWPLFSWIRNRNKSRERRGARAW